MDTGIETQKCPYHDIIFQHKKPFSYNIFLRRRVMTKIKNGSIRLAQDRPGAHFDWDKGKSKSALSRGDIGRIIDWQA